MHTLISLPYSLDALAPVISAETLSFHHGKHLQGYVDNLNKLIAGTPFEEMPLEEIVRQADGPVFNNAGQILNHNLYFTQFRPASADPVSVIPRNEATKESSLLTRINTQWGSLDAFKSAFVAAGVGLFGSLVITQEPGAGNPVRRGLKPLLTFDVWEHAYYLDYQIRRAAHLDALWGIVDWEVVEERYER